MAKRNRLQEEKDYADLMSVNEETQVNDAKKIINKLLPNDIKVISKNDSQKKLIKSVKNKNESSLDTLLRIFENTENFGVISMSEEDTNVRNPLITIMEDKFKSHYELVGYNNGNGNGK
jgi:hypothetical protein